MNARRAAVGAYSIGQAVEFDAGRRGGVLQAVCVEYAGTRWVVRATDGKTWRVPAAMLRPAVLAAATATAMLSAGTAREVERDAAQERARTMAHSRLSTTAARFAPGQSVDVVHRGSWGWRATVVRVEGGKVVVTNPARALMDKVAALNGECGLGRRTTATVTLWADRVRVPGTRPAGQGLLGG